MKFTIVSTFPAIVAAIFAQTATAYVRPVKDCTNTDEWDVVVVGSGTAGSIVAAELATGHPDKCVLVLEAGKHSGQVWTKPEYYDASKLPESSSAVFENEWTRVHESPETAWNIPGTYDAVLNNNCWGNECEYGWLGARVRTAKIVGGGSAINGALMQYPNIENWDAYPDGWKFKDMKPFLDEIETKMDATSYPSADGKHYNDDKGSTIVREAMEGIGYKYSEDATFFMPKTNTMGIPRVGARNGRRTSPASEYLAPALEQTNIELWTETEAMKIVLDTFSSSTKATGLNIVREGEAQTVKLAKSGLVVVSGGGVLTDKLLIKSDIGPGEMVENEAVGRGLTDKVVTEATFTSPGMRAFNAKSPTKEHQDLYIKKRSGPLTQFGPLLAGFIDTRLDDTDPDKKNTVEFFVGASQEDDKLKVHFVHFTPKKDPNGNDMFNRDYTWRSFDKAISVVEGAMNLKNSTRVDTGDFPLNSMNHPAGTCEIGECVDEKTLILNGGVTNIAVVDNSLLPEQAVVHSVFALMAIALRAAGILKNFWGEVQAANDEL